MKAKETLSRMPRKEKNKTKLFFTMPEEKSDLEERNPKARTNKRLR